MKRALFIIPLLALSSALLLPDAYAKDSDIEARGALISLTVSSVTVGSLTCNVTSSTEFKDEADMIISPAAFSIGDNVKLVCRGTDAKELERKLTDDNTGGGGSNGGNSGGNSGGSGNGSKELEIKDKAAKTAGVNTKASGKVEYSYLRDKKGRTDINLKTTVKIPVPSTIPLIASADTASGLSLYVVFSREGSTLANCSLAYDSVKTLSSSKQRVEYKLDLRDKRGSLSSKKGACDNDPDTAGTQSGIPGLKRGDTYIISDSVTGDFLTGTL